MGNIIQNQEKGKWTMSNTGYRIYDDFQRPEPSLMEGFRDIPVPNIGDCMNRCAALPSRIRAFHEMRMIGTAYTVSCCGGDNLLFYYAIDHARPGDVIVVAGGGYTERAYCGEIMATMAKKRGLAGFVVDGAIRDPQEIRRMDFPVFAAGVCPNGPFKNGPGEINVPVSIGSRVIFPGDILVGDPGGIVVIRPQEALEIQKKARAVMEKEAGMMRRIEEKGGLDLSWMYEKLKKDGVLMAD